MTRHGQYAILQDEQVIEVDMMTWAGWFDREDQGRVGLFEQDGITVSTVFLGLNHQWRPDAPPLWFETMIFGGIHDQYQERYTTLEQAVAGHAAAVLLATGATLLE